MFPICGRKEEKKNLMIKRTKYQGVLNIVRFNWPFYVTGLLVVIGLYAVAFITFQPFMVLFPFAILVGMLISLLVSWYVYDLSGIYRLKWLDGLKGKVLNINAGFDETTTLVRERFPNIELDVADFYDEKRMTEASIRRAREAYPLEKEAKQINIGELDVANDYDKVLLFFAAHEIRNENDRIKFFKELNRIINNEVEVYIVEHLRDWKNFIAYTIGFFHFYSRKTWVNAFEQADFNLKEEIKLTPFVSLFKIGKNGITS